MELHEPCPKLTIVKGFQAYGIKDPCIKTLAVLLVSKTMYSRICGTCGLRSCSINRFTTLRKLDHDPSLCFAITVCVAVQQPDKLRMKSQ
jgi:hypothetical protein